MDDGAVGVWWSADGVLDEPGEAVGDAAVEAEDILVEIGLEAFLADGAVVGAQEPALGEAEDEVDAGQAQRRVAPAAGEVDGLAG